MKYIKYILLIIVPIVCAVCCVVYWDDGVRLAQFVYDEYLYEEKELNQHPFLLPNLPSSSAATTSSDSVAPSSSSVASSSSSAASSSSSAAPSSSAATTSTYIIFSDTLPVDSLLADSLPPVLYVGDKMPIYTCMDNGPARFSGELYYFDTPFVRFIIFNNASFSLLSDYTVAQTWLHKVLSEAGDRWKVVLMHSAPRSVAIGNVRPLLFASLYHTLQHADVVFAGHDRNYARHAVEQLFNDTLTTPLTVVTTSSDYSLLPRCSVRDQRLGANTAFCEQLTVTADTLSVVTRVWPSGEVYDSLTVCKATHAVLADTCRMPEVLSVPPQYEGENSIMVRRSRNRIHFRLK